MKTIDLRLPLKVTSDDAIKLHEVSRHIYKARKTSLLTGAGISCNAGIPDFRSEDGLYNIIKEKYPTAFIKGQDLFDISLFRNNTTLSIFCTFMEGLYTYSLQAKATETHRFIKTLKDRNKLLRCYTQNIDSLEKSLNLNCGIDSAEFSELSHGLGKSFRQTWNDLDVVQLHGNLQKLLCTQCLTHYEWTEETQAMLKDGENPECQNCHLKYQERLYSGKRLTGNIGILRPDIVLYGENHPQSEILSRGLNLDMAMKCDMVLIMGTSLKVDGVKRLVRSMCKNVQARGGKVIFVNKTPVPKQFSSLIDYEVLCDCDDFVRLLRVEIPDLFLTQEQLDSKRLKKSRLPLPKIKTEVKTEVMTEVKREVKTHVKKEPVPKVKQEETKSLTPPATPSKKRVAQIKLTKPSLKRRKPLIRAACDLPSPSASFSEDYIKLEPEYEVITDTDEPAMAPELTACPRLGVAAL